MVRMTSSLPLPAAHMKAVLPSRSGSSFTDGWDRNTPTVSYENEKADLLVRITARLPDRYSQESERIRAPVLPAEAARAGGTHRVVALSAVVQRRRTLAV